METQEYSIIDVVYPVGSIYMSVNTSNPSTLFPNTTWEKIEGKFLLGSDSNYTIGSTGGAETHTLTVEQIPAHNHNPSSDGANWVPNTNATSRNRIGSQSTGRYAISTSSGDGWKWGTTGNTGGGQAHNNMPPYLVVNIWKRTA